MKFIAQAALVGATALLLAGCAQTPPAAVAINEPAPDDAGLGQGIAVLPVTIAEDGDDAITTFEEEQMAVELAMVPVPSIGPTGRPKPETGRAAICGTLKPGGRGKGFVDSGGLKFHVECFRAERGDASPAVLILHGARGLGRNPIYDRLAAALNERGINAFVLQYLAGEGAAPAAPAAPAKPVRPTPPQKVSGPGAAKAQPVVKVSAPAKPAKPQRIDPAAQIKAIGNAITAIQALSYVDHQHIGMFGLSLGGFHALALASGDQRISAVVDMFGAMPQSVAPTVTRMPPTLVLHGDNDAVVPVRRAHELAKLLKTIGAPHEVKIYKAQGHSFRGQADEDSIARSVDFLLKWLRSPAMVAGTG